jgi:hypothetical protein
MFSKSRLTITAFAEPESRLERAAPLSRPAASKVLAITVVDLMLVGFFIWIENDD